MIWLLGLCALLSVCWLHAEIGWADERAEHEYVARQVVRLRERAAHLRERNLRLAAALWMEPFHDGQVVRIVADNDAAAIEALIADSRS